MSVTATDSMNASWICAMLRNIAGVDSTLDRSILTLPHEKKSQISLALALEVAHLTSTAREPSSFLRDRKSRVVLVCHLGGRAENA